MSTSAVPPIVEELRKLLGPDVVLLPIPRGKKAPNLRNWPKATFADMQDAAYLRLFANGCNVGVLLGKPSGGICTIDLDDDEAAKKFLDENPKLQVTLITKRKRGCNVWVRIRSGNYPLSGKIRDADGQELGEWRADRSQTVIRGEAVGKGETQPTAYTYVHEACPVEIQFEEIQWPKGWVLPWVKPPTPGSPDLVKRFGQPYYVEAQGGFAALNESFWAGLYAEENVLLYEPEERCFYAYDPKTGLYCPESEDALAAKLSARMLEASRQMNVVGIEKRRTATTLSNITRHLRGIVEKRGAFNQRAPIVHLANGVIVFHSGVPELVPFSPDFYSRNASPIAYDPDAKCERFLKELVLPAVQPDDVVLLQKFAGKFLMGVNPAQRLLVLDGKSGRGKTQLAIVFQGTTGHANCTQLRTEHLGGRFETFRFLGKTLLVGVDVDPDFLSTKGAAVIKGLVGGDYFDAEQKFGTGSFRLQGNFNVLITSNARLRVRLVGDVDAWRRRLTVIRFEGPPPSIKIPDLGSLLVRTEGPGILNWELEGAAMALAEIPATGGDFALTDRQKGIVDSLLAESDSLRHFLEAHVTKSGNGGLTCNEILEKYAAYCQAKGWRPLSAREGSGSLKDLMLELFAMSESHSILRPSAGQTGCHGYQRGYRGIAFK